MLPNITDDLTIDGAIDGGASRIVIDANYSSRILTVLFDVQAELHNAVLQNGVENIGGAISNAGTLTIVGGTLAGNSAQSELGGQGGGIYNIGTATIVSSRLTDNSALGDFGGQGGGIFNKGVVTLDGSTLSNNQASDATGVRILAFGGGLYNDETGAATITDSTLSGNSSTRDGGAIENLGTLTIESSTLSENTADVGGAIRSGGALTVVSSTLSDNLARTTGGAILGGGTTTLTGSTLSGNLAPSGGAIANGGDLTVHDSTLSSNSAIGAGGGGAIINTGSMIVTDSTISGNSYRAIFNSAIGTATISGSTLSANPNGAISNNGTLDFVDGTLSANTAVFGAAINNTGTLTVDGSTLSGNSTGGPGPFSGLGGAITNFAAGAATIANSTLSGNSADERGGAIWNIGQVTVGSSTIFGNSADEGGGIFNFVSSLILDNTIVAGNTAATAGTDIAGGFTSNDHNLIGDSTDVVFIGGSGNHDLYDVDPLLGPLQDNGGPTETHALLVGSPAINAGDASLTVDQRGFARPVGPATDIGAYELNTAPVAVNDSANTNEDAAVVIDVLDNDGDPDGGAVMVADVTEPVDGSAVINPDGTITYTPDPNFNGVDEFSYTLKETGGLTDTATVTVFVTPVNDAPAADPQSVATDEDASANILLTGVDGDPETSQLLSFAVDAGPSHGTLTDFDPATGSVTYTPEPNYNGADSFTFTVSDDPTAGGPSLQSAPATVSINVAAVNDAPVNTVGGPMETAEDTAVLVAGISVADVDAEEGNGELSVSLSVQHGSLALASTAGLSGDLDGGDGELDLTGGVAALNAALAGLSYASDVDFVGEDVLRVLTNDLGNAGSLGPLSDLDFVEITVLSTQQQTANLIASIELLRNDNVLNRGQARSLTTKLTHAVDLMERDQVMPAVRRLVAFKIQVYALSAAGFLPTEEAECLLSDSWTIIRGLLVTDSDFFRWSRR